MKSSIRVVAFLACAWMMHGQWIIQDSHSTASLRGIHSLGGGVAWASGTNGSVLRTLDGGKTWQTCAVPPAAEKLDFRGVQAFDEKTAIVMSSGTGDLSRVYKTTDACRTWKLAFSNPDPEGFWDAIQFSSRKSGILLGDPVGGQFPIFSTGDGGETWKLAHRIAAVQGQSIFAASNTSLILDEKHQRFYFVTGGTSTAIITVDQKSEQPAALELASGPSAGAFSLASRANGSDLILITVGGDYKLPEKSEGTASFRWNDHSPWQASSKPPHGYRSAVAFDPATKTWIAVGTNGTDSSRDEGRTWQPLTPSATDAADTDRNWNALSLPFAVGAHGRIGKLRP